MATYQGRRRPDMPHGDLPEDVKSGDYWKVLTRDGKEPLRSEAQGKLTDDVWMFSAPNGAGIGTLGKHTVREESDGTASIRPNDGSSNSVLIKGGPAGEFHGYMEHGVWSDV